MTRYHLRVETGARSGELIPLPTDDPASPAVHSRPAVTLGRGVDVRLQFADETMSRVHGELRWDDGTWTFVNRSDVGSRVAGELIADAAPRPLSPGETLILGATQLVFEVAVATAPLIVFEVSDAPRQDPLTPTTPKIARAPSGAGYDTLGKFHAGQTKLRMSAFDLATSWITVATLGSESGGVRFKKRRLYFLAILALLGLAGCLTTAYVIVLPAVRAHPGAMLKASLLGLLPAIPYLLLLKLLDRNGQIPFKNVLACAFWGATVGCGAALILNALGSGAIQQFVGAARAWSLTTVFLAPLIEEAVKGGAVLVVFWILHDEFDNVLEGLILGAASGLGFALVENCIYNVNFLAQGNDTFLLMGTYRAVVYALIGHPIYTAMTGAGLGLLRATPRATRHRVLFPLFGLLTAISLHVIWNAAAINLGELVGDADGLTTLVINTVVFGGSSLAFFVSTYVFATSRQRRVLITYLSEEVAKGFVEPEELASFARRFGRLRYEVGGLFAGGLAVYLQRRRLRKAQLELALRKWHLAKGDDVRGRSADAYVKDARERIRDARNALNTLEGRTPGPR